MVIYNLHTSMYTLTKMTMFDFLICGTMIKFMGYSALILGPSNNFFYDWRDGLAVKEYLLLLQITQVCFPESIWWFTTMYDSSSRGSNTWFWDLQAPGMFKVHLHAGKTYTLKSISLKVFYKSINPMYLYYSHASLISQQWFGSTFTTARTKSVKV